MEKIIKVEKWKQNLFRISFASNIQMLVSEDMLVHENLFKEKEITDDEFQELEKKAHIDRGYQLALHYLSYQLRSQKEIKDYLKKKEIDSVYFPAIMDKLIHVGVIDDQFFSDSYVRTMMRTSDKGPKVITQQLKKKGIKEEEIIQSLELFDETEILLLAKRTAEKLLKKYYKKSSKETYQNIYQNLLNKGFDSNTIQMVMDDLNYGKDEVYEYELICKSAPKYLRKVQKEPRDKQILKLKHHLYQRGFSFDLIYQYIDEFLTEEDENE